MPASSMFDIRNRPTIRGPVNPLDRSTIVSVYNKQIIEQKPTIQPGIFILERGTYEKPSLTIIEPSSWWKDVDIQQPLLEIPMGSVVIAESVVKDYCNGLFACNMSDCMPGIFFVPGVINELQLKTDATLKAQLAKAKDKQDKWYTLLVKFADSFWAVTKGNPLSIMDDMIIAAKELGLDKEWAKAHVIRELIRCIACGNLRNPTYPRCNHCLEYVDKPLAIKLGLLPDPDKKKE